MNYRYVLLALAVALAQSVAALAQSTAIIQGTVVDSSTGKAVPGAIVMASTTAAPITRKTATSSYNGIFQIPSLPAGTYSLCVQFPADGYLNTCQWGSSPTSLTLAAAQNSTGNTIKLKAGTLLKVHVNDPQQLLNQKTKDGYLPDLVAGVWSGGMFYAAHVASKAAVSADYQVTVPFDTNLNFSIQSRRLALGDANQSPLANNADQKPFQQASTAAVPAGYSFTYSVLAVKP